jgi:hypothetical protein
LYPTSFLIIRFQIVSITLTLFLGEVTSSPTSLKRHDYPQPDCRLNKLGCRSLNGRAVINSFLVLSRIPKSDAEKTQSVTSFLSGFIELSRGSTDMAFPRRGLQERGGSHGRGSNFAEISRVSLTIDCDSFNFNFNVARIPFLVIGLSTDVDT